MGVGVIGVFPFKYRFPLRCVSTCAVPNATLRFDRRGEKGERRDKDRYKGREGRIL